MLKSPAINWYFDNWDGGTKLFTRHQKGCYIDLLSAQFHCGRLSLENIKQILGPDFSEWDKALKAKFDADENGMFFSQRMEHEIEKKKRFQKKQSENGKKGGRPTEKTQIKPKPFQKQNPKESLYETEIEIDNGFERKGGVGEKQNFEVLSTDELNLTFEFMQRIGKKDFSKDDILNFWQAFIIHKPEFVKDSRGRQMQHFRDWLKLKNKVNGTTAKSSNLGKSSGFALLNRLAKGEIE